MSVTKLKLKEGELSSCEQLDEIIRKRLGYSEESYGLYGHYLKEAFMMGLWIGCHGESACKGL